MSRPGLVWSGYFDPVLSGLNLSGLVLVSSSADWFGQDVQIWSSMVWFGHFNPVLAVLKRSGLD